MTDFYLQLISRLVSETGSRELDIEIAKAFGEVRMSCYATGDADPETGHTEYTSPEWKSFQRKEMREFEKTGELMDMPIELCEGPSVFGQVHCYSTDLTSLMNMLPDDITLELVSPAEGKATASINGHAVQAENLTCALAAAMILDDRIREGIRNGRK